METTHPLSYIEWVALSVLYQHRDRPSSPVRYVGLLATVKRLIEHKPPLAAWIGKPADNQIHITTAGIAAYQAAHEDA